MSGPLDLSRAQDAHASYAGHAREAFARAYRFVPSSFEPEAPFENSASDASDDSSGGFDFHLGVYVRF
jgi:hypothetical protein